MIRGMGARTHLVLGLGALVALGASVAFMASGSSGGPSLYESPNFDGHVPNSGLSDWISYGDYVVVGTVVSESEVGERQVHGDGSGSVGRSVTVMVERTLWTAPGFRPIESIEVGDWGWGIKDGELRPSGSQMRTGERYMLPLARFDDRWGYIGLRGYEVDGDELTDDLSKGRSWLRDLGGMSLDELAATLAATEPDPRVASLRHLSAKERAEAVFGEGVVHSSQ